MNTTLEDFVKKHDSNLFEAYKRLNTPNYYECGVLYTAINGGKELLFENCTVYKDKVFLHFKNIKTGEKYGGDMIDVHFKMKRIDENVKYNKCLINDKSVKYVDINDNHFDITCHKWRNYTDKELGGRLWVYSSKEPNMFWELYSHFGSKKHLKTVTNNNRKPNDREVYNIKYDISMRDFKKLVFGDPNVKITNVYDFPIMLNIWE